MRPWSRLSSASACGLTQEAMIENAKPFAQSGLPINSRICQIRRRQRFGNTRLHEARQRRPSSVRLASWRRGDIALQIAENSERVDEACGPPVAFACAGRRANHAADARHGFAERNRRAAV